jgi:hypothetical protein
MLPLLAPGVAATGSRVLSAGIVLGAIPRAIIDLAGGGQTVEASTLGVVDLSHVGLLGRLRGRNVVVLRRLGATFLRDMRPPSLV